MIIDEKKLRRQEGQVQEWIRQGCSGTIEACTGYGKTYVIILAIQRLHRKYPNVKVDVVVPKINLLNDWVNPKDGHLKTYNLKNVEVFVSNTYCKFGRRDVGLLCPDEIHNYASEEFIKIFEVAGCVKKAERTKDDTYILGATATIERIDGKHRLVEEYAPVFDTVTIEEARREGYISNYKVYNLGLELNEKDREEYNKWHSIFNNSFCKFNHNFSLGMACSRGANMLSEVEVPIKGENGFRKITKTTREWILYWANEQEWDGERDSFWSPQSIAKYAQQFMTSMRNRKTFIYRADVKFETVLELVKKFPVKTMIFSEDTSFADRITEAIGDSCRSYHTKIQSETIRVESINKKGQISYKDKKLGKEKTKEYILEKFKKTNEVMQVSTVRSLNEGFDYEGVRLAIKASYNSSKRDSVQRDGRAGRKDYNDLEKTALIINLYIKDSQEEKWLRESQKGRQGVIWVDSINQINVQSEIFDIELT